MNLKKLLVLATMTTIAGGSIVAQEKKHLEIEELLEMQRVGSHELSPNAKDVVYTISFPSIENNKIRSEIFTISANGKDRKKLSDDKSSEYSPKWIAGGSRIAYMSMKDGEMQLFSMAKDGTDIRQLSFVKGGISDYLFSPDESKIIYVKDVPFSNEAKNMYKDLPKTSGLVINDLMYRHWDEFVQSVPHLFLADFGVSGFSEGVDLLEGENFEAPMKPFPDIADVAWSPDGKEIAYVSRKKTGLEYSFSTNSDIYIYDIESKKTRNITEGMMGYDTHPKYSKDGKYIAWVSMERDGFEADLRRLFVMDRKTSKKVYVTEGFEYDINSFDWDEKDKSIYFISCKEAETNIFNIDISKVFAKKTAKATIKQITSGQHDYVAFSLVGKNMIASRQSIEVPKDLYNVDLRKGNATQITFENKELLSRLDPIKVEKRWMKTTDGGNMLVWVVLPPNFDPNKKYPALLYCQGGPQSTVSQFFSYRWNLRLMAEKGYVVVAPNRHGVPGFGKAWNEQISGDYSGQNIKDYLTAIDNVSKEPWVDENKLGAVGASYGGYSVYYLAGNSGDRFKALIAHNGIFDLEMQYLTTEEMWFANWDMGGAPWDKDNKVAQRTFANSPSNSVANWKAPILVIHSGRDYRIDQSQGFAAFNAAKMRNVPSQFLYFPEENHWVLGMQNSVLWHRTFYNWLDKWLK